MKNINLVIKRTSPFKFKPVVTTKRCKFAVLKSVKNWESDTILIIANPKKFFGYAKNITNKYITVLKNIVV